jgi:DNA-binding MurR/RpiR family transcriptional regulator
MEMAQRIREAGGTLTSAERRVAEVLLARPQLIGFGTVADLAGAAGTGAATVIRLATKLGFTGFSDLQASVQHDLARQLRPAAERIRERGADNPLEQHRATEVGNVTATLDAVEPAAWKAVVGLLADLDRRILVVAGDAATGVALQFVTDLFSLRPNVCAVSGNEIEVRRELAFAPKGTVVLAIDLRRYDRWVLDFVAAAAARKLTIVTLTDSVLSPLAQRATHTFVTAAESVSPFDSHVGTLALLNLLVASVADAVRSTASERLDCAEQAWASTGALTDG